ncbi:MAG: type III secretion system inner membrane ring subunit SctD [Puniceicoccales bacterium]|jgi:type III secretion system YscD/HrpQ family protein|nr:type III secretion system inner membrane ring subunit SctD [Puniceicoccales bacterium]
MGLLLKVLSGTHQGAEFDIPEEEIIIGAVDECDVIISAALVANRHMQLSIVDKRVFITPLEGDVFVAGKRLRTPSAVDNFQFVTIGTTHMMFGEADHEQWKSITPGSFPELEKEEEVAAANASEGAPGEIVSEEGHANANEGKDEEVADAEEKKKLNDHGSENIEETKLEDREIAQATQLEKSPKLRLTLRQRVIRYTTGFIVCFGIALVISITVIFLDEEPPPPPPPPLPIEVRMQNAIDALKLDGKIKVSKVGDGPVSIVGYVNMMADSLAVKSASKTIAEDASIKLFVMEKIINTAQEMVKESKRNVILKKSAELGEIIAMGYIKKEEIWTNLKSEIASIKGIINIKDEVLTKDSIVELAKSILGRYKFQDKLEAAATEEGVEIKGTISDIDKDNWTKAREDFEKTFKKKAQLNFMISVSSDRNLTIEKFFGGKIDSVNFNNQGLDWINIKNGNKYFRGSVLPSGYVVDQIEQDSVTIRNSDEVIKLDLEWM